MALTQLKTAAIADDAVTTDKLANAINTERTANTAKSTNATHTGEVTGSGALTITADAVTGAKIADDAIDSEHYTDGSIDTAHIADNQITLAKMAGGTDGQIITYDASGDPVAVGPGTDGQVLTSTGAGSPPAFEAIPASGKATNLVINGAMNVAQRGTSSTSTGKQTIDMIFLAHNGADEAPTQEQVDVASGTTPYTLGFRKAYKVTNGNQTSSIGTTDYVYYQTKIEAQNIAQSGWNYTSSSSNVTLSFWIKSSVAQNFNGYVLSYDGTQRIYRFETGSLSADTWTKITKTIPGDSNLTFNNDTGPGLAVVISAFWGSHYTDSGASLNTWDGFSSPGTDRQPVMTSTWWTTNDATMEVTGLLLEVGDSASDYPHISYADELLKCYRYYYRYTVPTSNSWVWMGQSNGSDKIWGKIRDFPVQMRAAPTCTISGSSFYPIGANQSVGGHSPFSSYNFENTSTDTLYGTWSGAAGIDTDAVVVFANTTSHYFDASADM